MDDLIIATPQLTELELFRAIDSHTKKSGGLLSVRTRSEYKAIVRKAQTVGVDFTDHDSLTQYAHSLTPSNQGVFSALVNVLSKNVITQAIKASDINNPADALRIQALKGKAEILKQSVKPAPIKNMTAHTWLTADQVVRIVDSYDETLRGQSERIVMQLLFKTGMRRNEAIKAKYSDIHMSGGSYKIKVKGKGGKIREIPVPASLMAELDEWKAVIGAKPDSYILRKISWGKLTEQLPYKEIYRITQAAGRVIGMNDLSTHDTRRTYAQRLLEADLSIVVIQTILGHADPKTTMKYLDMDKATLPDVSSIFG